MAVPTTRMEFAVRMTCQSCADAVKKALDVKGIETMQVAHETQQVMVRTALTSDQVKELIESTGREAVLVGMGSDQGQVDVQTSAAVAILEEGLRGVKGVVRFVQAGDKSCLVEGTVDGLPPGPLTVCLHQYGDISRGCDSCGEIIGLGLTEKVKGILKEVEVGPDGRTQFRFEDNSNKVWDLVGRSLVLHQGAAPAVLTQGSQNSRLACGIIARSAGLFENDKKICACDGVTIWEERNRPVAGPGRKVSAGLPKSAV